VKEQQGQERAISLEKGYVLVYQVMDVHQGQS
jgi:hypothetical protein